METTTHENTEGLFTRLARLIDEITDIYESLTPQCKTVLRRKGFGRRHIISLHKVQQAMIDANFLMTGLRYKNQDQMELKL